MEKFERSVRRHHLVRVRKARYTRYAHAWIDGATDAVALGKLAHTACVCSCWMCGHQRRWHGPRLGELRRMAAEAGRDASA